MENTEATTPAADAVVPPAVETAAPTENSNAEAVSPTVQSEPTPEAGNTAVAQPNVSAMKELGALLQVAENEVTPAKVLAFIKSLSIPSTALDKLQAAMDHIRRCSQNGHAPSQDFIRLHGDVSVSS